MATETKWFIDGQELIGNTQSALILSNLSLPDGIYEICMESVPDAACSEVRTYCEMVEIDYCYEVSFDFTTQTVNTYIFNGTITSSGGTSGPFIYEWYVNDMLIESDGPDFPNSDNQLMYTFPTPGTYEVCMRTDSGPSARCFAGEFCRTIVITDVVDCPTELMVDYTYTTSVTGTYVFNATSSGALEDTTYQWFIDGVLITEDEFGLPATDATLIYKLENQGTTYEICAEATATFSSVCILTNQSCKMVLFE